MKIHQSIQVSCGKTKAPKYSTSCILMTCPLIFTDCPSHFCRYLRWEEAKLLIHQILMCTMTCTPSDPLTGNWKQHSSIITSITGGTAINKKLTITSGKTSCKNISHLSFCPKWQSNDSVWIFLLKPQKEILFLLNV